MGISVDFLLVEGFAYYYSTTHTVVLQQQIQTKRFLNSLQLNANNNNNNNDDDETKVRHQLFYYYTYSLPTDN